MAQHSWFASEGAAHPLGATWIPDEQAFNFALYTKHATSVTLLLYADQDFVNPAISLTLNHLTNKSGRIWHCRIPKSEMKGVKYYAYRIEGPKHSSGFERHAFDAEKILLDPYARSVFFPKGFDREAAKGPGPNAGKAPLGVLFEGDDDFDWGDDRVRFHEHDLVIYEMHVRGYTYRNNSGVAEDRRGTFLGVIDKIPYLKSLGVTAVELLPVHQFDPLEGNYWGYMTLNFFAPHHGYSTDRQHARQEFREMVRALHAAGIEVILDVVFNHTAESDHTGPCYSYKGICNSTYYIVSDKDEKPYRNFSGTGNTLHCANRAVSRMILDSLRHWVTEYHVDGFRFDLASVFARRGDGSVYWDDSPIVSAIRSDPILGQVRLIAEPWDARGLHQLGAAFPGKRWLQWNDRFRDEIRRFVRGDKDNVNWLMYRIYGSDDVFPDDLMHAFHPYQSINYINSHDGFTLYDLVAYNQRHNEPNGENNRDGQAENFSWNCGVEGDDLATPEIMELRRRQVKNFCTLTMISNGTPMFCAGDEFLNTQFGNNNPYNQDNEITWLNWDQLEANQDVFRFFQHMIQFRKSHPTISRSRFYREDIRWYGCGRDVDMSHSSRQLAYYLDGASQADVDLYVMINSGPSDRVFEIEEQDGPIWSVAVDTAHPSPEDIYESGSEPEWTRPDYLVRSRSVVVLLRLRDESGNDTREPIGLDRRRPNTGTS